jgi:hypothetical protein
MAQNRNSRPNKRNKPSGPKKSGRNPNSPKRIDLSRRPNKSDRGGSRPVHKEHGLGGEQVEGRQAVRELLLGSRRRVHEIWIANDIESSPVIDDILEINSRNEFNDDKENISSTLQEKGSNTPSVPDSDKQINTSERKKRRIGTTFVGPLGSLNLEDNLNKSSLHPTS